MQDAKAAKERARLAKEQWAAKRAAVDQAQNTVLMIDLTLGQSKNITKAILILAEKGDLSVQALKRYLRDQNRISKQLLANPNLEPFLERMVGVLRTIDATGSANIARLIKENPEAIAKLASFDEEMMKSFNKALDDEAFEAAVKAEMKEIDAWRGLEKEDDVKLEQKVRELIADSNPKFPLSERNAKIVINDLKPPGFTPEKIAGPGGEGADIVFQGPNGEIFKIEVKCIHGGFSSFNRALSHAAQKQAIGNIVFIQVKEGADVSNWLKRFLGNRKSILTSQDPADILKLHNYRSTDLIILDDKGNVLLSQQKIFN